MGSPRFINPNGAMLEYRRAMLKDIRLFKKKESNVLDYKLKSDKNNSEIK